MAPAKTKSNTSKTLIKKPIKLTSKTHLKLESKEKSYYGTAYALESNINPSWDITEFKVLPNGDILIKSNFGRKQYNLTLNKFKPSQYRGLIFSDKGEKIGNASYTLYENEIGYILRGDWVEDSDCYDSFIQIWK